MKLRTPLAQNLRAFTRAYSRLGNIIGTFPLTLTNGTTIDALPVMTLFNYIQSQVNANAQPLGSGGGTIYCGTSSGTNTIVLTPSPAITSYTTGQTYSFLPANTNTAGAATIAISGLSAIGVTNADGSNPLSALFVVGCPAVVMYTGTKFISVGGPPVQQGTWTPGIAFGGSTTGITYSVQAGSYQTIGNLVYINGFLTLSSVGSASGFAEVTGLPFAGAATPTQGILLTVTLFGSASITGTVYCDIPHSTAAINLNQFASTGNSILGNTNFTATTTVQVCGCYAMF